MKVGGRRCGDYRRRTLSYSGGQRGSRASLLSRDPSRPAARSPTPSSPGLPGSGCLLPAAVPPSSFPPWLPQSPPRTAAVAANFPEREVRALPGLTALTDCFTSSPSHPLTASESARPLRTPAETFTPTWPQPLEPSSSRAVPASALGPLFQALLYPSGRPPTGESPHRSGPHGASCSCHPHCHSALNWGCPARSIGGGLLLPRPEHSPSQGAKGRGIRRGVVRRGRRAVPEGVGAQLRRSGLENESPILEKKIQKPKYSLCSSIHSVHEKKQQKWIMGW